MYLIMKTEHIVIDAYIVELSEALHHTKNVKHFGEMRLTLSANKK